MLCAGVAHHLDDAAEAGLGDIVGGRGVHRGEDLDVDLAAPVDGQLEQPQRVPGRCRVEDGGVEGIPAGKIDEDVEGGHLLGAGRIELLAHGLDRSGAPSAGHRVGDDAVRVRDRGRLGVDAGRPQAVHASDRRRLAADGRAEDLPDVRGRIGRHEQRAVALARQPDGGGAGDDRLAHATLAREEDGPGTPVREQGRRHGLIDRPGLAGHPVPGVAEGRPRSLLVGEQRDHGAQSCDAPDLAVEEGHAPRGHGQHAFDLGEVALLHGDARSEERRGRLLGRQDAVHDELGGRDAQARQLRAGTLRLGDGGGLRMEHEGEPRA